MRLNYTGNTSVFARKNRENSPRIFFLTCKVKPSQMRLDFTAHSVVSGRKNGENAPITFLYTLEADNSKNAPELHGKQLCFETQKSGKCAQDVFINFASGQFQARRQDLIAGGPKTRRRGTFLKYCIGCMQQPRAKHEMGGADFKRGGRALLSPPLATALDNSKIASELSML